VARDATDASCATCSDGSKDRNHRHQQPERRDHQPAASTSDSIVTHSDPKVTMALDIALLAEDGTAKHRASIGVDAHHRLMQSCDSAGLDLLLRIRDYYAEAEFFRQEFPALSDELRRARVSCEHDPEILSFVDRFAHLLDLAARSGRSLVAIPD
jgi:hypothetical protein